MVRRHPYHAHGIAGLLLVLCWLPLAAQGGWATNAWPAWEWPRAGKIHAEDCFAAFTERMGSQFENPSYTNGFDPSFWRTQRGNCISNKVGAKNIFISEQVEQSYWIQPDTIDNLGYATYTNNGRVPAWHGADVPIRCGLPTNYWTYTPWRALNGGGPFTNDTTVGHPYGWTNEYTVAGGTNFPSGRSTWYTTDYGWEGLKTVANAATVTCYAAGIGWDEFYTTGIVWYGYASNLLDAIANAQTSAPFSSISGDEGWPIIGTHVEIDPSNSYYYARATAYRTSYWITNQAGFSVTNTFGAGRLVFAVEPYVQGAPEVTNATFDAQGYTVSPSTFTNGWNEAWTVSYVASNDSFLCQIGSTNFPSVWPDDWVVGDTREYKSVGWMGSISATTHPSLVLIHLNNEYK